MWSAYLWQHRRRSLAVRIRLHVVLPIQRAPCHIRRTQRTATRTQRTATRTHRQQIATHGHTQTYGCTRRADVKIVQKLILLPIECRVVVSGKIM